MSYHKCIRCGVENPDTWYRYDFIPQEPGSIGGSNVICDSCDTTIVAAAVESECRALAEKYANVAKLEPLPGDGVEREGRLIELRPR